MGAMVAMVQLFYGGGWLLLRMVVQNVADAAHLKWLRISILITKSRQAV
jgi:hypothetical protein